MTYNASDIIQFCLEKKLRFAAYTVPGSEEVEIVVEKDGSRANSIQFVMSPFELKSDHEPVEIKADFRYKSTDPLPDNFTTILNDFPSVKIPDFSDQISVDSKEKYLIQLQKGIDRIKTTNLDKFIYSRSINHTKSNDFDLSKYLFSLIKSRKNTFTYLVQHENCGIWIGATPETLASWKQGQFDTMSLAGTQAKIVDKKPIWSPKEIEEHTYVTRFIERTFSDQKIAFQTGEMTTTDAGPVYHLLTPISSQNDLNYSDALGLAKALHPTPAVCGVPVAKAKEVIQEVESHDRAYYTGYIGIQNPNEELALFVNLRCMQVLPNFLALYVGGGITDKSVPEDEWTETELKAKTLSDLISKMS